MILLLVTLLLTGCIGMVPANLLTVYRKVIDGEGVGIPEVTLGFSGDFGIATTDNDGQWSKEGLMVLSRLLRQRMVGVLNLDKLQRPIRKSILLGLKSVSFDCFNYWRGNGK